MLKEVNRAEAIRRLAGYLAGLLLLALLLGGPFFAGSVRAATTKAAVVTVRIPVACQAAGIQEAFRYSLKDERGALAAEQLVLKDGQEGDFLLHFSSVGTYPYTVTQEAGTAQDVSYDASVFRVLVYVVQEDGGLRAQTILYREGADAKITKITFVNTREDGSGGSNGGDGSGDDSNNGGNAGEDGSGSGDSNGSGGSGSGDSNGSGGSGSGDSNGSGGSGLGDSNGSGTGSSGSNDGSGSFWGNGSFWGSNSSAGSSNTGALGSLLVRTGDQAKAMLWTGLLLAALAAAAALLYQRNKQHEANRKDREHG